MKLPLTIWVPATSLTAAVWIFFDWQEMRLGVGATTFVLAFCLVLAIGVRSLWRMIRKTSKAPDALP